jgi:hypothetical protein
MLATTFIMCYHFKFLPIPTATLISRPMLLVVWRILEHGRRRRNHRFTIGTQGLAMTRVCANSHLYKVQLFTGRSSAVSASAQTGGFFPNASNFNVNHSIMGERVEVHQHYHDTSSEFYA